MANTKTCPCYYCTGAFETSSVERNYYTAYCNMRRPPIPYGVRLKFHDSPGMIKNFLGLEFETSWLEVPDAAKSIYDWMQKWGGVCGSDGSVNGIKAEIRTAPARGIKFMEQIRELCNIFEKYNGHADRSCGMHLHIDFRNAPMGHVNKAVHAFEKVQPKLWKIAGESRLHSEYCRPIQAKNHPVLKFTKDNGLKRVSSVVSGGSKYSALNLARLGTYGTLENRMHAGCTNFQEIMRWAKLNDDLAIFAKTGFLRDGEFKKMYMEAK